ITRLAPTVDFIAGTLSGIAGLIVGHPFDTIKVRLQSPTIAGKYSSTLHAFVSIVHEERLPVLFKGITSPLVRPALLNGLGSYFPRITSSSRFNARITMQYPTPTELIKIRQQEQLVRTSASQIALKIFKESGIPRLYCGMTVTTLRDIGYAAYFVGYEGTLRFFPGSTAKSAPWYATLVAGGVAGIVGWMAMFPLDVVKTRMQGTAGAYHVLQTHELEATRPQSPSLAQQPHLNTMGAIEPDPYRSVALTISNSYRAEGVRELAPTIICAIPVNMVTFATFE
ncbi:carnitine/acyl carnitine carrier, partial [Amanita rubescens]